MPWIISLPTPHKVVGEEEGKNIVPGQSFTGENRKLVSKAHPHFHVKTAFKKLSFKGGRFYVYQHTAL